MKNYVQKGDVVTITAFPYVRTSGQGVLMGSLFGVAVNDTANGATGEVVTDGVFTLDKVSAQAWTQGVLLYWDDTAKLVTTVSTSNKIIGTAHVAAANPTAQGQVRLNGAALS
jgi:predicted RecA/RadA family phage recombinase